MISFILHKPEHPGNVGAIARILANFGFEKLILIDPQCDHLSEEALKRAKHGKKLLEQADILKDLESVNCDWVFATSGKIGSDYNIARSPLTARIAAEKVAQTKAKHIGILFGPESRGLTNQELSCADAFIHIKAAKTYPILNLSHSVGIIAYEIFNAKQSKKEIFTPLSKKDKQVLFQRINDALDSLTFTTKDKKETQQKLWQRIIGKALLTRREAFTLMGFLRKVEQKKGKQ